VYDLANLSLKFDRHLDAEVVDFQILTDDYSKAAFLCSDRTISFHARFGSYYKVRTPRQGRDLAYAPFAAELLVVGSAQEVYRVSLEEGRFMQPLAAHSPGINACGGSWGGGQQLLVPYMQPAPMHVLWRCSCGHTGGQGEAIFDTWTVKTAVCTACWYLSRCIRSNCA
jgi:hypothetical protein